MPVCLEVEPHLNIVSSGTPARGLSQADACAELKKHIDDGRITIRKPRDKSDEPYDPEPGKRVEVKLADVCGIRLTPANADAKNWKWTNGLDLRMAVLLCRFLEFLKDKWEATEVYWGGLGVPGQQEVQDAHSKGCAMDFHGAQTNCGSFMVERDWGLRLVPGAGKSNIWPLNAKKFSFRLDPTTPAGMFFHHVYDYLTTQAHDAAGHPWGRTTIGMPSYIIHPDHPGSPEKRRKHRNHIHFEVPWR